jgi:adenylosuccinate lyase
MIPRYTRPRMGGLWTDASRYSIWLEVEICACEGWAQIGRIPKAAAARIRKNARFNPKRIARLEEKTRHDVVAFVSDVGKSLGRDAGYFHLGLTSSDILDTALAVQLSRAGAILLDNFPPMLAILRKFARKYRKTLIAGRTHGVFAEPTALGLKFALWYADMQRARRRLVAALDDVVVGKLSGSVGNFANIDPRVEQIVCRNLGLRPAPVSTQVVQRDRHAALVAAIALCGSTIEKMAIEIRHLHRTEVGEIGEGFRPGQRGSSSMPHKKNPIGCEQMSGMARLLRSYSSASMENIPLWHERDISHSSAERVILPDATILLDYMLVTFTDILGNLRIDTRRMKENLLRFGGAVYSQRLLSALAEKTGSRERAYTIVQPLALGAAERGEDLQAAALSDSRITDRLTRAEIAACFDDRIYTQHAGMIIDRALADTGS